jgi:hypothetical protein
MAATCKTCKRPDVDEINRLIGEQKPLRYIVDNFGIPQGSIQRHKDNCIDALFAEVREEKRAGLLSEVDKMKQEIEAVKTQFVDNANVRVQLIARQKDAIDLEAKLTGAYVKEKSNPSDIADIAQETVDRLVRQYGWKESEARAFAQLSYPEISESVN